MNSRNWRVATTISLSLSALGAITVVACSDSSSADRITHHDATLTPLGRVSASAVRERKRVHERNKEEFVGVAHNKALDDFRRELRKPGTLTKNVCDYVLTFATHEDRLPTNNRVDEGVRSHAARTVSDSSTLCRKSVKPRVSGIAFRSPLAPLARAAQESPEAQQLLYEIQDAVAASPSSYDLAGRLNPVLDRAAALPASDQLVIGATVSVAQNSFEYWETNYDMFAREVQDDYGACAGNQYEGGVPPETARDNCMNGRGDAGPVAFDDRSVQGKASAPRLAGKRSGLVCEDHDFRAGFGKVVGADIKGAISGAVSGFRAGGPEGAVAGAIIGAAVGSVTAALELAWQAIRCIYQF
jgi:hypothetical protein